MFKSPQFSSEFKTTIISKLSNLIELQKNLKLNSIILKSIEGLSEFENTTCKHSFILNSLSNDIKSTEFNGFLDLQVETFFTILPKERIFYLLEQLKISLNNNLFQKAKYIISKIDFFVLSNEQKIFYFHSKLTICLYFKDFNEAMKTFDKIDYDSSLKILISTFNCYFDQRTDFKNREKELLEEFSEKNFIDEISLNLIIRRYENQLKFLPESIPIVEYLAKCATFHVFFN